MHWLFLLMAIGCLFMAVRTTSMPLMVVLMLVSLCLFVVWIIGRHARRLGETRRDESLMIDPAELRRLREIAEARRNSPPPEPPTP